MISAIKIISSHLTKIELWAVAFFVALNVAIPGLLPITIGVALFFWINRYIAYGHLTIRTPVDWSIIILFVTTLISLLVTSFLQTTQLQVLRLISGILLFYAIVNWTDNFSRLKFLLIGTAIVGLLLSVAAPLSVQWSEAKLVFAPPIIYERFTVLVADAVHPNVLAGSLVIILPIILAWLIYNWQEINWLKRIPLLILCFVIIGVLTITQSRAGWISFILVFLILVTLRWRWGWIVFVLITFSFLLTFVAFDLNTILQTFSSDTSIADLTDRTEIWSRAIFILEDFPFTGIGMGTFADTVDSLYPHFINSLGSIPHAHNLLLQIGVDLGLPGLISWTSILLVMLSITWKTYRNGKKYHNNNTSGLGVGLLLSQVALITHGALDSVTWGMVRSAPIVWAIWGMSTACWMIIQNHSVIEYTNITFNNIGNKHVIK